MEHKCEHKSYAASIEYNYYDGYWTLDETYRLDYCPYCGEKLPTIVLKYAKTCATCKHNTSTEGVYCEKHKFRAKIDPAVCSEFLPNSYFKDSEVIKVADTETEDVKEIAIGGL